MLDLHGTFEPYPYTPQRFIDGRRYTVELGSLATPEGPSPYSIVRMRPFACILPVVDAGTPEARVVLVRQFRYAVDSWQIELPAGGIELGEDSAQAAMRELREESGFLVDELVSLGHVYPSGGSTDEVAHLFAARCSRERASTEFDKGEQIETVYASAEQMEELLLSGACTHAVSYALWMRFCAVGLRSSWFCQKGFGPF